MNTTNNRTKVDIKDVALVFVGGSIGTFARYSAQSFFSPNTAFVTFVINLIGTFALGLSNGLFDRLENSVRSSRLRLLVGTGVCGGFTTYSLLALELQTATNLWALSSIPFGVLLYSVGHSISRP